MCPSAAERTGDFGELCADNGGTFNGAGQCSVAAGQLWDPYTGTFQTPANGAAGAYRSGFIPFNNLATYTSPGNPNLNGTPFQLPATAGNLIDPVALKMLNLFPMPNFPAATTMTIGLASGATPNSNDQFDIKIDYRFNEKKSTEREVLTRLE